MKKPDESGFSIQLQDRSPDAAKFLEEVLAGLRESPKQIPSKYLYDERGSELFEEICGVKEYYPTRTEIGPNESVAL